jgi:hypothetical protein
MRRTARLAAFAAFVTLGAVAVRAVAGARAVAADSLQAERSRLRVQLDKVNAEIDALKRAGAACAMTTACARGWQTPNRWRGG